jgi:hypothetical protein
VDNPNGLFSAQAAPKPPPAMYSVTEGMKVGGKVIASSNLLLLYAKLLGWLFYNLLISLIRL